MVGWRVDKWAVRWAAVWAVVGRCGWGVRGVRKGGYRLDGGYRSDKGYSRYLRRSSALLPGMSQVHCESAVSDLPVERAVHLAGASAAERVDSRVVGRAALSAETWVAESVGWTVAAWVDGKVSRLVAGMVGMKGAWMAVGMVGMKAVGSAASSVAGMVVSRAGRMGGWSVGG